MPHKNFEQLSSRAGTTLAEYRKLLEELEKAVKNFEDVVYVLRRLATGWHTHDPGKYGDYVFFARNYEVGEKKTGSALPGIVSCEPFFAEEVIDDLEEAKRGVQHSCHDERKPVPLGKLAEAARCRCPRECFGNRAYVIGIYSQAEDSPEGDLWQMNLYALCPECLSLELFAQRREEWRFL